MPPRCAAVRNAVITGYVAAALSFLAGVARDWHLVNHVVDYQQVFGAMYAAAIAASFSVNAVTLGHGFERHRRRLIALVVLSLLLFVAVAVLWQGMAWHMFWWVLPVPALYVVGAVLARRLLDHGHVLLARVRDGAASLLMLVLVVVGLGLESFPLSVLVATALLAVVAARVLPHNAGADASPAARSFPPLVYAATIFYSNLAPVMVNGWAMWANGLEGSLFGYPLPVVVRVALYGFQLGSLPSVLIVRWRPAGATAVHWKALTWCCLALAGVAAALPIRFAVVLFPLAALATLYTSVLMLHHRHHQGGPQ